MAGGKLTVEIGADKTDFDKKIKEVEFDIKELSKVKLEQLKVGLDTTQINAQIKDAKASLNSLKTTVKDTGGSFTAMAPKVANGGNALMQFSRIAQDAPYGIIGIGNNITATTEAFAHLKNSTGSTGGALKALAGSLMGSGGILLGVSLLTTGLTLLSQSGLSVGDVIDKLTGKYNEFGASLKKAREEGADMAGKEVESLRSLIAVAQNDNIAKQQRLIAVDKLQKQFPAYYGNLSAEKIMYGDLTKETQEATKALIARAVAEKLGEKAADVFAERLKANGRYLEAAKELEKFDDDIQKKRERVAKKQEGLFGLTEDIIRKQAAGRISILKSINDERNNITSLTKAYEKYSNIIDKLNETAAPLTVEEQKDKKIKVKKVKFDFKDSLIEGAILPSSLNLTSEFMQLNIVPDDAAAKARAKLKEIELVFKEFGENISSLISGSISDAFAGIGSAIGNALASGGNVLKAIGGSLLSSLGGLLTDMGKMAIQVGVGLLAIKTALKSLNPAVAIGAGVALIALGSFFSSKSSSIGGSVGGGGRGASSSSGSGANNQSFTSSGFSGGGNNGGTVVFEIAGQKLIGVLSNTLNANRRLGGQLGL
jgi:hypothetical protein